jgi:putative NADH-flavin reductase
MVSRDGDHHSWHSINGHAALKSQSKKQTPYTHTTAQVLKTTERKSRVSFSDFPERVIEATDRFPIRIGTW